ncbi:hypothetical protein [Streptomyces sp. NPDC057939]|uniref:hypothetical protein n=1 Tax=Streptomyces sp. NPDC057939 TaxID=3346284 RepID=UPI0036E58899
MTLVRMQPCCAHADPTPRTVDDAREAAGPQVCDDMTVEVALAVLAGARSDHLLVRDEDGLCTGLISRARLTAVRDGAAYTDRIRLRDVLGEYGPVIAPVATTVGAERAVRHRGLTALPVVDDHGGATGVLALAR